MTLKEAEQARTILEADGCLEVFVWRTASGDYLVKAHGETYWDIEDLDEDPNGAGWDTGPEEYSDALQGF